jgi:hypothetical protein
MKLPSSTLVETIVAITIISSVIMSGFMFLTKMNFAINNRLISHAVYESDRLIDSISMCKQKGYTLLQKQSLNYEITVNNYNDSENLLKVNLSVSSETGSVLLMKSKLILVKSN